MYHFYFYISTEIDTKGFKLRTCPCKCPKAVIELAKRLFSANNTSDTGKNSSNTFKKNSDSIKKTSESIGKQLQVNRTNLKTALRKKTSAADERSSSATFGVIALTLFGLELFLITLGDIIVVALYIKRTLVTLFCPTAGLQGQTSKGTGNQTIQQDLATPGTENTNSVHLQEKSGDESEK